MTAPLVFVIPVRHQDAVPDWDATKHNMAQTLASIAAQTVPEWECLVVANKGADLPRLPPRCSVVHVDLPVPVLPDRETRLEAYYDAIRADKGLRIYAGLREVSPDSHVMAVDYDDFVSRRLAELVVTNRAAPGWNFETGYVWAGGGWCYLKSDFHAICGTSHIIRRDLFGALDHGGEPDLRAIKRRVGSHIFIHHDLAAEGRPLSALPFPGAVYRIGNPLSAAATGGLFSSMTPRYRFRTHPLGSVRRLLRYRRVGAGLRNEFSMSMEGNR